MSTVETETGISILSGIEYCDANGIDEYLRREQELTWPFPSSSEAAQVLSISIENPDYSAPSIQHVDFVIRRERCVDDEVECILLRAHHFTDPNDGLHLRVSCGRCRNQEQGR